MLMAVVAGVSHEPAPPRGPASLVDLSHQGVVEFYVHSHVPT